MFQAVFIFSGLISYFHPLINDLFYYKWFSWQWFILKEKLQSKAFVDVSRGGGVLGIVLPGTEKINCNEKNFQVRYGKCDSVIFPDTFPLASYK